ncbi:hypothetical protein COU13_01395 [Candidatus Kaiserbacteria bacterium CG10_big_fil_rev_8_21_14_0_10_43_70]|uniref:Uncharacterized protein n=1 Tax=Candidatus Kaiserbacteria bacterium CG10_big_fil_rev_8_21_14_0_10_43_70 TaxID=1974605 RepID=A0A2H0UL08_9BACT|nr:MAG: hypothetical protein COU13_01395 [Candidatus Kaiserbacteria bacterium CG10_big_fil_rev_8_21_14_0_10_43_70]
METGHLDKSEGVFSKFKSPQEELQYLRERVKAKEEELDIRKNSFESSRIARREVIKYEETPAKDILHETTIIPDYDATRIALALEPEEHDSQVDELLKIISERGIKNALTVVEKMGNAHLEDDLHRALIRYIEEGFPVKGKYVSKETWKALHMTLFEIQPEKKAGENNEKTLEAILSSMEQLYAGLLSIVDRNSSFTMEMAVSEGTEEVILYVAVPTAKKDLLEKHISGIFSNARIEEVRGDYNIFNDGGDHSGGVAYFTEHPVLPLKTYAEFEYDPMNVLLSAFSKLKKHGEGAALQIVVGDAGDRYNNHYKKILDRVRKGDSLKIAKSTPETALGDFAHDIKSSFFTSSSADKDKEVLVDTESEEILSQKISSTIVPVTIRVVASASDKKRAEDILEYITSTFRQFNNAKGNRISFNTMAGRKLKSLLHSFVFRLPDSKYTLPLNLAELTTVFHLTAEGVASSRELKQSISKSVASPIRISGSGILLGVNKHGSSENEIRFSSEDRLRHFYSIGQTGTGKSVLMKNMIMQDIQNGEGVCYIDPHGSDVEDILSIIPDERKGDVIYFDPARVDLVLGLNMLEYDVTRPELKTLVVDEIYEIFRKLYEDTPEAFGPMFEQYYRNATMLVLEDPASGNTLVEISRVLSDSAFRKLKLSRCGNPLVVQFWEKIASEAGGEASLENIVPYITSKFDVFLANDIMRPIIAQETSAINFREAMDTKKIILINLSKGRLGDRNANLIGLIVVGKFLQAALSRSGTKEDLPPFYLYIDEFQNFTTPSIATIFSEARKYRLSLNVAHQFIGQLPKNIKESVFGNVGTKCAFRVGTEDAEVLEKTFGPVFTASDLENIQNYHAFISLLVDGTPAPPFDIHTKPFEKGDSTRAKEIIELSYRTYGRPREEVEGEIRRKFQGVYDRV